MKYKFKPLGNLHFNITRLLSVISIIVDISSLMAFFNEKVFDIQIFVVCLIISLVPILTFIVVRLVYPYYYVIDDIYITKYKNKKVLFKIEIKELKAILIKKATFLDYYKFIISLMTYYNLSTAYLTTSSFVFSKHEILTDYNHKEIKILPLNNALYPNCFEYVDIIPCCEIIRVAKLINAKVHMV